MATTRITLSPLGAEFPTSGFASLTTVLARPVLAFDSTNSVSCQWTFAAPQGLAGTLSAIVHVFGNAAGTAGVVFSVAVEAITPGDAVDLDSATSFDTANTSGSTAMPATQGHQTSISITLTNADSIAVGDYVRLQLARVPSDGGDTFAADAFVTLVELREA